MNKAEKIADLEKVIDEHDCHGPQDGHCSCPKYYRELKKLREEK